MVVLDSDILVDFLRGNSESKAKMEKLEDDGEKLNTTVINEFELIEGAYIKKDEKKFAVVENLLRSFEIYELNSVASWKAAEISAALRKSGEKVNFEDIAIASIAICNGEVLVTRNVKHFRRIKELKIDKW